MKHIDSGESFANDFEEEALKFEDSGLSMIFENNMSRSAVGVES
jgi:hypothetical protein